MFQVMREVLKEWGDDINTSLWDAIVDVGKEAVAREPGGTAQIHIP